MLRRGEALQPSQVAALADDLLFGPTAAPLLAQLEAEDLVLTLPQGRVLRHLETRPARNISLRAIEQDGLRILRVPEMVQMDQVDLQHAIWEVYEGAIFLHQGETYLITLLDRIAQVAHARPVTVDYFTRSRDAKDVDVVSRLETSPQSPLAAFGTVMVRMMLYGYYKFRERTLQLFETVECFAPPVEYTTRGFWVDVPAATKQRLEAAGRDFLAGMHGATHALKNAVPMHVLCDPGDIDCEHIAPLQERPRLVCGWAG